MPSNCSSRLRLHLLAWIAALAALFHLIPAPSYAGDSTSKCADCHDLSKADFAAAVEKCVGAGARDIHFAVGLSCEACHTDHATSGEAVIPARSSACRSCHEGVFDAYRGGGHYDPFEQLGLPHCATCHIPHGMPAPDSEFALEESAADPAESPRCTSCHFEGSRHRAEIEGLARDFAKANVIYELLRRQEETLKKHTAVLPRFLGARYDIRPVSDEFLARSEELLHAVDGSLAQQLPEGESLIKELSRLNRNLLLESAGFWVLSLLAAIGAAVFVRNRFTRTRTTRRF